MSFEGKTSIVLKHGFTWSGQAISGNFDSSQTTNFNYSSSRLALSNTFHFNWMKLQSAINYANQQWVYAFQTTPSVPSGLFLQGWDMYDTDGAANVGSTTYTAPISRWYPPYSHGIAGILHRTNTSFVNSTGNTTNRYLSLEY